MDIINKFRKYDLLTQLLIICIILIFIKLLYCIVNKMIIKPEYFTNNEYNPTFSDYDNSNLFDNFYSNLYDRLHNNNDKNITIVEIIKKNINPTSVILDIGCGTGEIVNKLSEFNVIGLDKSESMISLCRNKFPNNNFVLADILNNSKLNYNYEFTHILCLNYTIYYINDRNLFFKNAYDILLPYGILILHLVDKDKYNRTLNACRLNNFNPSKYLKEQPIQNSIDLESFKYTSVYNINNNKGIIDEIFEFDDKSVRKNTHILNLDETKVILNEAKKYGFIIEGKIKIKNNDGEYIYILKKNL